MKGISRLRRMAPFGMMAVLALTLVACEAHPNTTFTPHSEYGRAIDAIWDRLLFLGTIVFVLVEAGILFIILLRRTLTVDAGLPFPESRACSEIVKTGQKGDTGARYVFGAMGLGMLIQVFKDPAGIPLFRESVRLVKEFPASVIHHMDSSRAPLGDVTHRGALVLATPSISPALIGVGYIIGFELSAINFAGGVLGWLVLSAEAKPVPFFGLELPWLIGANKELAKQLEEWHKTIGNAGYYLIGLHAAAALGINIILGNIQTPRNSVAQLATRCLPNITPIKSRPMRA